MMLLILIALVIVYLIFVSYRIGIFHRIPLALSRISLEEIPGRAAKKYREKIIFTCDKPCEWLVPALRSKYKSDLEWSAMRIKSTAGYLAQMFKEHFKISYGDRVAILKKNHFDYHLFIVGIVRAGGVACPVNGKFAATDVEPYMNNIGAKILITDSVTLQRLIYGKAGFGCTEKIIIAGKKNMPVTGVIEETDFESALPGIQIYWLTDVLENITSECGPVKRGRTDPVYLVHSSGTTGFPKAVILRNSKQSYAVRGWLCYVHISRAFDKSYLAVPNNHQAVILTFNSLLLMGAKVHWQSQYDQVHFDTKQIVSELANGKYTGYFGFPVTYTQLKESDFENYDLSSMRFWASTADAAHEAIIKKFVTLGSTFTKLGIPLKGAIYLDAQGSSEVGTPSVIRYITSVTNKFERRIGKPGSTPFGPRIRITENGIKVKKGEVGRLEVKGKTVMDGYWNNHTLTFNAIKDDWFFTGDVARQENDGHLVQLDREVDVIQTNHGNVYSLPIEEKIHKHPAIYDACVYGAKQFDGSELPAIAVALRKGFDHAEEELLAQLNKMVSKEEQLCRCEILDWSDFPIGVTGKTLKRVFRDRSSAAVYFTQPLERESLPG